MGAGGRISNSSEHEVKDILKRVPVDPPFSLIDLKKAIPAHCFERSVIGHECGHHAFSKYQWIDDTAGFILHSPSSPRIFLGNIVIEPTMLTQTHLITMKFIFLNKYERFANHFDPLSPIFTERERSQVVVLDIGILALMYAIKLLVAAKGAAWVACMGIIRDFGFLNMVFHDVTHTHVLHHLISYIPHYHAKEARDAIKPVLGEFYKIDRTPIFKAMWREAKECIYIEPDMDTIEDYLRHVLIDGLDEPLIVLESDEIINKNEFSITHVDVTPVGIVSFHWKEKSSRTL
nr:hypothetical protein [Tanacetum cinerariifolium]